MDRRSFLQRAGLGSIAAATLPTLALPALAEHESWGFDFVVLSSAGDIDGVQHRAVLQGNGTFNPSQAVGGGTFLHFDAASGVPATVIGAGLWRTKRLVKWESIGWAANFGAGILEAEVELVPQIAPPGTPPAVPALLTIVCNVGPAGLDTGKPEGVSLAIEGVPLPPFAPLGTNPPFGLTLFTRSSAMG